MKLVVLQYWFNGKTYRLNFPSPKPLEGATSKARSLKSPFPKGRGLGEGGGLKICLLESDNA